MGVGLVEARVVEKATVDGKPIVIHEGEAMDLLVLRWNDGFAHFRPGGRELFEDKRALAAYARAVRERTRIARG